MISSKSIAAHYLKGFILMIVLPVLVVHILFNHFYIQSLQKNASDQILQAMDQISNRLADEGKRASLLGATIASDDQILGLANRWNHEKDLNHKLTLASEIDSKLDYLFHYTNEVESIMFFFRNSGSYFYKTPLAAEESLVRKETGFAAALRNRNKAILTGSMNSILLSNSPRYILSVWITPAVADYHNDVTVILCAFRSNGMNNILFESGNPRLGEFLLAGSDGQIIGAGEQSYFNQNIRDLKFLKGQAGSDRQSFTAIVKKRKMFISICNVPKMNWELINIQDYRVITHNIDKLWRYATLIIFLFIGLFLAFSALFFRKIILPLNRLIRQMRLVEQGNFEAQIEVGGNDELHQLGESFNKMVYEIKNLMIERDIQEKARGKAELEALKSQINPHFIANTLNSIRLMAMIAKAGSIQKMIEALMKLLSSSLGKDEATTAIAEEMENLRNYVHIMKVRYGDKFDVIFNIDQELLNTGILKMILQPILENAILHGMSEKESKGVIKVTGSLIRNDLIGNDLIQDGPIQGDVVFEIYDNGVGISPDQVRELLKGDFRNPKGFSSIGIGNVESRIKLNYGNRYGLTIESVLGQYTLVKVTLPLIGVVKGEFGNVSSDGCGR